jgi:hypothetical protein
MSTPTLGTLQGILAMLEEEEVDEDQGTREEDTDAASFLRRKD